jgi:AraC-like DNA-binding protein
MLDVPQIPIAILEATWAEISAWNHDDTAAPWWRWYWNDRAGWTARYRERSHALLPDRVVLIAPETKFTARSQNPAGHLYLHFSVGPPFHQLARQVHAFELDAPTKRLLRVCRRALEQQHSSRVALSASALCATALLRLPSPGPESAPELLAITRFMRDHATLGTTNQELASRLDMHPGSFARWFKRQLGTTPHAWLTERKLERACSLLRFTELSIESISSELGFCDRFYFSRVFRRYRGCSPSSFRKRRI